ncbi:MAG: tetratricopeptide repeat protein [Paludibacteraceae bacterium]|nr:tetratricopeptide repeat protein [Paludibacteraceae bacterium]
MAFNDSNNNQPDPQLLQVLQRYEKALNGESCGYFDEEDLEDIFDYYADRQMITEADKAINFALQFHPASVPLKARLVRLLIMQDRQTAAAKLLHTLLQLEPENVDVLLCQADLYLYDGKNDDAKRIFKKLVLHPVGRVDEICLSIGFIYFDHKMYAEARTFLSHGYSHGGQRNYDLCFQLAVCNEQLGFSDEAIRIYNIILDHDPYSNDAWFNLGQIYFMRGQYDEALEAYDYASITGKDDFQAFLQIAHCYFQKESYQKALEAYQNYSKRSNDQSAPIHIFMGECYEQMENLAEAYRLFEKATVIDPENPDGWAGMCICLMDSNKYHEALPLIQKAIRINSEVGSYWVYLGDIYENLNELQLALNAYFHAQIYFTDSAEINASIGEIYVYLGNFEAALSYLLKAKASSSTIEELPLLLAICFYKLGQVDQASDHLTLAILKKQENEKAFFELCPEAKEDPHFTNFNHEN